MKASPTPQFARPRFARLKAASLYSGIGRSKLYQYAAANDGLFRKNGKATIVDLAVLDRILNALPTTSIKPPRQRRSKTA